MENNSKNSSKNSSVTMTDVILFAGIIIAILGLVIPCAAMDIMGIRDEVALTIMCLAGETVGWFMIAIGVLK